jgi:hypothetical protein
VVWLYVSTAACHLELLGEVRSSPKPTVSVDRAPKVCKGSKLLKNRRPGKPNSILGRGKGE